MKMNLNYGLMEGKDAKKAVGNIVGYFARGKSR